jgi:hypothetical protein
MNFGVGVAVQIARVVASDYEGSKLHPCLEPGFHDSAVRELLHDEDGHQSAGDNKGISLFSYSRPPALLWSKPKPNIAVNIIYLLKLN